jgi:hypothetical protein
MPGTVAHLRRLSRERQHVGAQQSIGPDLTLNRIEEPLGVDEPQKSVPKATARSRQHGIRAVHRVGTQAAYAAPESPCLGVLRCSASHR